MGWTQRISAAMRAALLSVSAYSLQPSNLPSLDSPSVEKWRAQYGGQLSGAPPTRTRWYLGDLEVAEYAADAGDLSVAGQIMRSFDCDGFGAGLMSTRAGGLVRLPKVFRGPSDMVDALQSGGVQARSVFDEMCPASELERFTGDGVKLGIAVAELVPVEGRDYPVFVRRLPENLVYRWSENRYYFRAIGGLIPITPGDGRWVLHTPGGREAPWQGGLWRALARAYITKTHAREYRDNWEAKLAHPARVATAPSGTTREQHESWFSRVAAWGINTVFALMPGYDVKLLESNGRGAESWVKTIREQNEEMMIAISGQLVTTTGGTGFANAGIHASIRADLIKATAESLAHTINTQVLPAWVLNVFGELRLPECPTVEWDVTPPSDRNQAASALQTAANAIMGLTRAYREHGLAVDVEALSKQFGVPLKRLDALAAAIPANEKPSAPRLRSVPSTDEPKPASRAA